MFSRQRTHGRNSPLSTPRGSRAHIRRRLFCTLCDGRGTDLTVSDTLSTLQHNAQQNSRCWRRKHRQGSGLAGRRLMIMLHTSTNTELDPACWKMSRRGAKEHSRRPQPAAPRRRRPCWPCVMISSIIAAPISSSIASTSDYTLSSTRTLAATIALQHTPTRCPLACEQARLGIQRSLNRPQQTGVPSHDNSAEKRIVL